MQFQSFQAVNGTTLAPMGGASATLYEADGETVATIYSRSGSVIGNPTTCDPTGLTGMAAANGGYYIKFALGAYSTPLLDVSFLDPADVMTPEAMFAAMQAANLFAGFSET